MGIDLKNMKGAESNNEDKTQTQGLHVKDRGLRDQTLQKAKAGIGSQDPEFIKLSGHDRT